MLHLHSNSHIPSFLHRLLLSGLKCAELVVLVNTCTGLYD
jgi:hypothetical protein